MRIILTFLLILIPTLVYNTTSKKFNLREYKEREYRRFRDSISFSESGNKIDNISKITNCIGLFQFSNETLETVGFGYINDSLFKVNPDIFPKDSQIIAFDRLVQYNTKRLKWYINKYHGDTFCGIKITKAGILAAAHLSGAGKVKKFFREKYVAKDTFGTKVTDYMIRFSNYKF